MHPSGGINKYNIVTILGGLGDGSASNGGGVFGISLVVEWDGEAGSMDRELFDGSGAEGVARGNKGGAVVGLQVVSDFGEGRGLAHS